MVGILGEWTSIFEEEYEILDCLMAFVLWVKGFCFYYNIFDYGLYSLSN